MNSRVVIALFVCALWATAESLVLGAAAGATALTIGAATITAPAVAALGLGALAVLKGVLLKKHFQRRRYGRDVTAAEEEEEDMAIEVAVAQQMDSAGCVAKLLCEIESMSANDLTPAMASFKTAFENNENLKASRGVYNLAISFGSKFAKTDSAACGKLFDRCVLAREDLAAMLDTTFSC